MSPEEREKRHAEMRKEWDSLTPEQRAERRKMMHESWEKMPAEERAKMRAEMKDHCDEDMPKEAHHQMKSHSDMHSPAVKP